MPVAHSRRLRVALWIAVAGLAAPVTLSIIDLARGDKRAWLRLAALAVALVALLLSLVRQRAFEQRAIEKERLDAELRASQAQYSGILSIAADAIISVDERQRIVHFNHGAEVIFGWPASEAIGRELNVLIPERFRPEHPAHMARFATSSVVARRMGERSEIFGLRRDGTEFPAEASISKLDTPAGLLFSVVLRDITARKRAETDERFLAGATAQLGQSLEVGATRQAAADLPVPYLADACVLDLVSGSDTFTRVVTRAGVQHPALASLARRPLTPDSPSPVIDVIRRQRSEAVASVDAEWLEANEESTSIADWTALGASELLLMPLVSGDRAIGALTLVRTGGRAPLVESRAVAAQFAAAAAAAIDNARLYELARHATRARDDVLGVVSHDLRNPISAIAMCARTLQDAPPADAAERDALLVTIQESTRWIDRLIQDLVDVAHIERGQLSLDIEPQDATRIVLQARHLFEVEASRHGITLEVASSSNLPLIAADGARLVQVLSNLLRNAIKFTPDGGRITLSAVPNDAGGVTFSVRDSGAGIPAENLERIFDRHWESSNGARTKGSGLGLSIARGIVQAHGGEITVRSAVGEGAEFRVSIGRAAAPAGRR